MPGILKTINSLSGGPTSSYLASNYVADVDIFAMVCIDNHNAAGSLRFNKKWLQYANDKLSRYIPQFGEFRATAEDPIIIQTMIELEQKIGREITWVRGISFDNLIHESNFIPNQIKSFCTTRMKMDPIFEYCYLNFGTDIEMRLGIRYDEPERLSSITDVYKFPVSCNLYGMGRQNHQTIVWRKLSFPLQVDKIMHPHITIYWNSQGDVVFADDTNCQMCFWKPEQQLRKNFEKNTQTMLWAAVIEDLIGSSFKKENTLLHIKELGLQLDFNFGTGAEGCKSGYCGG